jgi:hypothetical protein
MRLSLGPMKESKSIAKPEELAIITDVMDARECFPHLKFKQITLIR